jgi:hypothetical protein
MKQIVSGARKCTGMVLLAVVSMVGLTGCRPDDLKILRWVKPETVANIEVRLDPNLTDEEREAVVSDAARLSQVALEVGEGSLFDLTFGSTDMSGVIRFLDERVNLIVSRTTQLESIIVQTRYRGERPLPEWMRSSLNATSKNGDQDEGEAKGMVVASNPGGLFWMFREQMAPKADLEVRLGNLRVPLSTSRIGLMHIGEGYVARDKNGEPLLSSMERIGTLVHEGRHSDCTGGIDEIDLEMMRYGFLPRNPGCLHLHQPCPEGHALEGIPACDAHAWGSYAMGAVFGVSVAKKCTNCTEEEIQGALIDALDSMERILPLEEMMAGVRGAPDMSSSGVRRTSPVQ